MQLLNWYWTFLHITIPRFINCHLLFKRNCILHHATSHPYITLLTETLLRIAKSFSRNIKNCWRVFFSVCKADVWILRWFEKAFLFLDSEMYRFNLRKNDKLVWWIQTYAWLLAWMRYHYLNMNSKFSVCPWVRLNNVLFLQTVRLSTCTIVD